MDKTDILKEAAGHYLVASLYDASPLDERLPPVEIIKQSFLAYSDDFSWMLSKITGWPMVQIDWSHDGERRSYSLVKSPERRLVDVTGWVDELQLRNRLGIRDNQLAVVSDVEQGPLSDIGLESNIDFTEASRVAKVIGHLPYGPFIDGWIRDRADKLALIYEAAIVLDNCCERAQNSPEVWADFEKAQTIIALREIICRQIEKEEGYPNPAFNGLAEATWRCLLLWRDHREAYESLVAGIAPSDEAKDLASYDGLLLFANLIRGLSDDHDWTLTRGGGLEILNSLSNLPTATPSSFLEAVIAVAEHAPASFRQL